MISLNADDTWVWSCKDEGRKPVGCAKWQHL